MKGRPSHDRSLREPALRISLRGRLPAPSEAWDRGAALAQRLLAQPGVDRCELTVNANKRRVVSWRTRDTVLTVSVHWALLGHHDDLVRLVTHGDHGAWDRLKRHLPGNELPADCTALGQAHDLETLASLERERLPRAAEAVVTWGRWSNSPPRRSLRLGSCMAGEPALIRIHPVLDHPTVPDWFVGFILFHELLHVVFPPIDRGTRRLVHPASFRAAERRHPHYQAALEWEQVHFDDLLDRAQHRARRHT